MGDMSRAQLAADLKAILKDSANKLTDPDDFNGCLDRAADDLVRLAPSFARATVTLAADMDNYPLPDDAHHVMRSLWGLAQRASSPWNKTFPGKLPTISTAMIDGARALVLFPAPTTDQIAALGAGFPFSYVIRYAIDDDAALTTVPVYRRSLLLARATVEALLMLVNKGFASPVALGGAHGVGSMPKNGHPAALAEALLGWCEQMAAA